MIGSGGRGVIVPVVDGPIDEAEARRALVAMRRLEAIAECLSLTPARLRDTSREGGRRRTRTIHRTRPLGIAGTMAAHALRLATSILMTSGRREVMALPTSIAMVVDGRFDLKDATVPWAPGAGYRRTGVNLFVEKDGPEGEASFGLVDLSNAMGAHYDTALRTSVARNRIREARLMLGAHLRGLSVTPAQATAAARVRAQGHFEDRDAFGDGACSVDMSYEFGSTVDFHDGAPDVGFRTMAPDDGIEASGTILKRLAVIGGRVVIDGFSVRFDDLIETDPIVRLRTGNEAAVVVEAARALGMVVPRRSAASARYAEIDEMDRAGDDA